MLERWGSLTGGDMGSGLREVPPDAAGQCALNCWLASALLAHATPTATPHSHPRARPVRVLKDRGFDSIQSLRLVRRREIGQCPEAGVGIRSTGDPART
eukprot:119605-Chlamydomonas_euryale.AAC.1